MPHNPYHPKKKRRSANPAGRSRFTTLKPTKSEIDSADRAKLQGRNTPSFLDHRTLDANRRRVPPKYTKKERELPRTATKVPLSPRTYVTGVLKPRTPRPDWMPSGFQPQAGVFPDRYTEFQRGAFKPGPEPFYRQLPSMTPVEKLRHLGGVVAGKFGHTQSRPTTEDLRPGRDRYPATVEGRMQYDADRYRDKLLQGVPSDQRPKVIDEPKRYVDRPRIPRVGQTTIDLDKRPGRIPAFEHPDYDPSQSLREIPASVIRDSPTVAGVYLRDVEAQKERQTEIEFEPEIYQPLEEDIERYRVLGRQGDHWIVEDLRPGEDRAVPPDVIARAEKDLGPIDRGDAEGPVYYLPVSAERDVGPVKQLWRSYVAKPWNYFWHGLEAVATQGIQRIVGHADQHTTPIMPHNSPDVILGDGTIFNAAYDKPEGAMPATQIGLSQATRTANLQGVPLEDLSRAWQLPDGTTMPAFKTLAASLAELYPDDPEFQAEVIRETAKLPFQPAERLQAAIKVRDLGMTWDEAIHGVPDVMVDRLIPAGWFDPSIGPEAAIKADPYTAFHYKMREAQLRAKDPNIGDTELLMLVITELEVKGLPGSENIATSFATDVIFDPLNFLTFGVGNVAKANKVAQLHELWKPTTILQRNTGRYLDEAGDLVKRTVDEFTALPVDDALRPLQNAVQGRRIIGQDYQGLSTGWEIAGSKGGQINPLIGKTHPLSGRVERHLNPFHRTAENIKDELSEQTADFLHYIVDDTSSKAGKVNPVTGKPHASTLEVVQALHDRGRPLRKAEELLDAKLANTIDEAQALAKSHEAKAIKAEKLLQEEVPTYSSLIGGRASRVLWNLAGADGPKARSLSQLFPIPQLDEFGRTIGPTVEEIFISALKRSDAASEAALMPDRKHIQSVDEWVRLGHEAQDYPVFASGMQGARERVNLQDAVAKMDLLPRGMEYKAGTGSHILNFLGQARRGTTNFLWTFYGRLNPGYSMRNMYNNWVTMIADGHFTLEPRHVINAWFETKGITVPAAARRGIAGMGASLPDAAEMRKGDKWSAAGQSTVKIGKWEIPYGAQAIEEAMAKRIVKKTMKSHLDSVHLRGAATADLSDPALYGIRRSIPGRLNAEQMALYPDARYVAADDTTYYLDTIPAIFARAGASHLLDDLDRLIMENYGKPYEAIEWLKKVLGYDRPGVPRPGQVPPTLSRLFPAQTKYLYRQGDEYAARLKEAVRKGTSPDYGFSRVEDPYIKRLQVFEEGDRFSSRAYHIIRTETDPVIGASKLTELRDELADLIAKTERRSPGAVDISDLDQSVILYREEAIVKDLKLSGADKKAWEQSTEEFIESLSRDRQATEVKKNVIRRLQERLDQVEMNPELTKRFSQEKSVLLDSLESAEETSRKHNNLLVKARADNADLATRHKGASLTAARRSMWDNYRAQREIAWSNYHNTNASLYDDFIERWIGPNSEFTVGGVNQFAHVKEIPGYDPAQMDTMLIVFDDMIKRIEDSGRAPQIVKRAGEAPEVARAAEVPREGLQFGAEEQGIVELTVEEWKVLDNWAKATDQLSREAIQHAGRIGTEARDRALLRYADRRNIDSWLGNVYPFHFWYSRTVPNWMNRAANKPYIMSHYLHYRDAMRKMHAGLSPYWQQQLSSDDLGIDLENPIYWNLEQSLSPLYHQMGPKWQNRERLQAGPTIIRSPYLERNLTAGQLVEGAGSLGPSVWAPIGLAMTLLNAETDPEAALAWVGSTASVFSTIRGMTNLAHPMTETWPVSIPPGGIQTDPLAWLANSIRADGSDTPGTRALYEWEIKRMVQYMMEAYNNPPSMEELAEMYKVDQQVEGGVPNPDHVFAEQLRSHFEKGEPVDLEGWQGNVLLEAYNRSGPVWERARSQLIRDNLPTQLLSHIGGLSVRRRTDQMDRYEDAYQNLEHIRNQREVLGEDALSQLYREHYAQFPEMRMRSHIVGSQSERNDSIIWDALSREEVKSADFGDLSDATWDEWYNFKTTRFMTEKRADELVAAAIDILEGLRLASPEELERGERVIQTKLELEARMKDEFAELFETPPDELLKQFSRLNSRYYAGAAIEGFKTMDFMYEKSSQNPKLSTAEREAYAAFLLYRDAEFQLIGTDHDYALEYGSSAKIENLFIDDFNREWSEKHPITELKDPRTGDVIEYSFQQAIMIYEELGGYKAKERFLEQNPAAEWLKEYNIKEREFHDLRLAHDVNQYLLEITSGVQPAQLSQFARPAVTGAEQAMQGDWAERQVSQFAPNPDAVSPEVADFVANFEAVARAEEEARIAEEEAALTYMDKYREPFVEQALTPVVKAAGGTNTAWNAAREEPLFAEWPEPLGDIAELVAFVEQHDANGLKEAMMKEAIDNGMTLENVAWNVLSFIKELSPEDALSESRKNLSLHDLEDIWYLVQDDEAPTWNALTHGMGFHGHVNQVGVPSIILESNLERKTSEELVAEQLREAREQPTYFQAQKDEHLDNFVANTQGITQIEWAEEQQSPLMSHWPVDPSGSEGLIAYVRKLNGTGLRHAMMMETSDFPKQGDMAWKVIGTVLAIDPSALRRLAERHEELHDIEMVYWSAYAEGYPTYEALYAAMGFEARIAIDGKASYYRLSNVERKTQNQIEKENGILGSLMTDADDRFISNSDVHEYIRRLGAAEIGKDVDLKVQQVDMLNLDGQYDQAMKLYNSDPRIAAFIAMRDEIWDRFDASKAGPGSKKFAKFFKSLASGERTEDITDLIAEVLKDAGLNKLTRTSMAIEKAATAAAEDSSGKRPYKKRKKRASKRSLLYEYIQKPKAFPELEPGGFAKRQAAMATARQPAPAQPQMDVTPWTDLMSSLQTSNPALLNQIRDYFDLSLYARQAHVKRSPDLARWLATTPPAQLAKLEQAFYAWSQQTGRLSPRQESRVSRTRPALANVLRVYQPRSTRAGI